MVLTIEWLLVTCNCLLYCELTMSMSFFQVLMLLFVWKLFWATPSIKCFFVIHTHYRLCIYWVILHIWRCELSLWRWFIYSEITCVEPRKGLCVKPFTNVHQFDLVLTDMGYMTSHYVKRPNIVYKTNLKFEISMRKNTRGGTLIAIFCAGQFQFDAIYSMILDFVSWSVYWQPTSLFTSRIGQMWSP